MAATAVDVQAYLPVAPDKANAGACALYNGELYAYAAASVVVVVDVHGAQVACVLDGGSHQSAVTAVAWSRAPTLWRSQHLVNLRLASGDADGGLAVWDVAGALPVWSVADASGGTARSRDSVRGSRIVSLCWAGPPASCLLAALQASGFLTLWDTQAGSMVWRSEPPGGGRSGGGPWSSLYGDPLDGQRLVAWGPAGSASIVDVKAQGLGQVRVRQRQHKLVETQPAGTDASISFALLDVAFPHTHDLLLALQQRQLTVFDLETGLPAAATQLPHGLPPFERLLGSFKAPGSPDRSALDQGLDLVYLGHRDGSCSVWRRGLERLTFSLQQHMRLVPAPTRLTPSAGLALQAIAAGLWTPRVTVGGDPAQEERPGEGGDNEGDEDGGQDGLGRGAAGGGEGVGEGDDVALRVPSIQLGGLMQQIIDVDDFLGGGGGNGGDSKEEVIAKAKERTAGRALQAQLSGGRSVLLMAVTGNGQVWQWDLPLPREAPPPLPPLQQDGQPARRGSAQSTGPFYTSSAPGFLGLMHTLPDSVQCFSVCPSPIETSAPAGRGATPSSATHVSVVLAAATSSGTIELVALARGALQPLSFTVVASLAVHKDPVQGIRWLGPTPRLVSYSTEKVQGGWRNCLVITDVRNRVSLPFREQGCEGSQLAGVRSSPEGRYLLLLFRGAPSEVWALGAVGLSHGPVRVRVLDLPFTAVEWVVPHGWDPSAASLEAGPPEGRRGTGGGGGSGALAWRRSVDAQAGGGSGAGPRPTAAGNGSSGGGAHPRSPSHHGLSPEPPSPPAAAGAGAGASSSLPEERLAFVLEDGRGGVLAVRGKRITDTKPRRPTWGFLAGPECAATAIAGWGPYVFLGDAEGNLMRWDVGSGQMTVSATGGHGPVTRLYCAPIPQGSLAASPRKDGLGASAMRLAVLFSSGSFGVWEVDAEGELRPTSANVQACRKVGRAVDIEWLPLPHSLGMGVLMAAALAEGSLVVLDTLHNAAQHGNQLQRRLALQAQLGGSWPFLPGKLPPPLPLHTSLLLPHCWVLLLRWLMAHGVPASVLRQLAERGPRVGDADPLEELLWELLPQESCDAWDNAPQRMGYDDLSGGGARGQQPAVSRMLDLLTDDIDEPESPSTAKLMRRLSGGMADGGGGGGGGDTPSSSSGVGADSPLMQSPHGPPQRPYPTPPGSVPRGTATRRIPRHGVSQAPHHEHSVVGGGTQGTALFHTLGACVGALAQGRSGGGPGLLTEGEWRAYERALQSGSASCRMAAAAAVSGDKDEACFWAGLPATLEALVTDHQLLQQEQREWEQHQHQRRESDGSGHGTSSPSPSDQHRRQAGGSPEWHRGEPSGGGGGGGGGGGSALSPGGPADAGPGGRRSPVMRVLWDPAHELDRSRERLAWHEAMAGAIGQAAASREELQQLQLVEYVALGDYQTAVGFLLASAPEATPRYYRDALTTLALASACDALGPCGGPAPRVASSKTLHVQAAKVITANASSFGDHLLGVPLLCSIGHYSEAVGILQDAGMWRPAVTLSAAALTGVDRAAALDRWAWHVLQAEGRLWKAVSICVAAGSLASALELLREAAPPDAAHIFCQACRESGVQFVTLASPKRSGRPLLMQIDEEDAREAALLMSTYTQEVMLLL